ncbi:hypothetical protein E5S67_06136 [Microcoleus sp. IPMA8]|uniref:Uncharacterized protein n=1 Tax=Microcoleus asticus IPMA8 TaxID=2563858 RepID=A0ABX2D6S7_9CYAN|nr:hypothetical protein [Microcoleus asticus IPMA8]
MTVDPAAAVTGPVLSVTTSAISFVIVVVTLASGLLPLLLAGTGSIVLLLLNTLFVIAPIVVGAVTVTVRVTLAPRGKFGIVGQVTSLVVGLKVPSLSALSNTAPRGSWSSTSTFSAGSGPLFTVVIV